MMAFISSPLPIRGTSTEEWSRARVTNRKNDHRTSAQLKHHNLNYNYNHDPSSQHSVFDSASSRHTLRLGENDIANVDNSRTNFDDEGDDDVEFRPYLPQTMEKALIDAQTALLRALADEKYRLLVELPLGRTRKYWSTLSPIAEWYEATGWLVSHFLQFFESADLRVVYSEACGKTCASETFISQRHNISEVDHGVLIDNAREETLIVLVGIPERDDAELGDLLCKIPDSVRVVMFNCRLGSPLNYESLFTVAYAARTSRHTAFARYSYDGPWHYFVEIAPFELHWIHDESCDGSDNFVPDVECVLRAAQACGCHLATNSVFYAPHKRGCEAGYWPFSNLAARYLLPLHGDTYLDVIDPSRKKRKNSTPFGFF